MNGVPLIGILGFASLGLGIIYLSSMARIQSVTPETLKGTVSGAFYFYWGIGMFTGPVVIDKLIVMGSSFLGFGVFAALLFLEAIGLGIKYSLCRDLEPVR